MKYIFYIIITLFFVGNTFAQDSTTFYIFKYSTPDLVTKVFAEQKLDTIYDFSYHLNPFYLRGDFNGDHKNDIAIPIKEKKTGKIGVAIIHAGTKEVFIFGAGRRFVYVDDDAKYIDIWSIGSEGLYTSDWEENSLKLKYEAINIGCFEKSGGLLYWDGKRYKWYHLID